jgi:hypothetical protein
VVSTLLTGIQCQKEKAPPAKSSRISAARRPLARDPGRAFMEESSPEVEEGAVAVADPTGDGKKYLKGFIKQLSVK